MSSAYRQTGESTEPDPNDAIRAKLESFKLDDERRARRKNALRFFGAVLALGAVGGAVYAGIPGGLVVLVGLVAALLLGVAILSDKNKPGGGNTTGELPGGVSGL